MVPCVKVLTTPVSAQWHPQVFLIGGEAWERREKKGERNRPLLACTCQTNRSTTVKPTGRPSFMIGRLATHQDWWDFLQHAIDLNSRFLSIQPPIFDTPIPPCYPPSDLPFHQISRPVAPRHDITDNIHRWVPMSFQWHHPSIPSILTSLNPKSKVHFLQMPMDWEIQGNLVLTLPDWIPTTTNPIAKRWCPIHNLCVTSFVLVYSLYFLDNVYISFPG